MWQVDAQSGAHKPFATGLRNPTALAVQPGSGELWAVVNERDELGPNLVPDYLTSVRQGGFYGWPYSYWGSNIDPRVRPQDPAKAASAITPDYSLGSHVAPLGLAFSNANMGAAFAEGAFVGEHGSWNRIHPVGYKVTFVPFRNGRPAGEPVDFITGFHDADGTTPGDRGRHGGSARRADVADYWRTSSGEFARALTERATFTEENQCGPDPCCYRFSTRSDRAFAPRHADRAANGARSPWPILSTVPGQHHIEAEVLALEPRASSWPTTSSALTASRARRSQGRRR